MARIVRRCRVCGCTDLDCSGCIERTGEPCHWVEYDLCSACARIRPRRRRVRRLLFGWAQAWRACVLTGPDRRARQERLVDRG
jgi:hypothetical protein